MCPHLLFAQQYDTLNLYNCAINKSIKYLNGDNISPTPQFF